jgi:hypothetical protein
MAETAAQAVGNVPAKFINADGTVNVTEMAKAYTELERAKLSPETTVPDPTPAPVEPSADTATPAGDESITDILNKPDETPDTLDWDAVRTEIATTGKLSDETLGKLKEAGVPADLVQAAVDGAALKAKTQMARAAELVGGAENLKAILEWARGQYSETERQALATALEGPLAETTLTGLAEAYKVAQPGKLVSTAGDPASGMAPGQKKIIGFANDKEMFAAMDDPRYQYDPEYQEEIRLRCAVNSTTTYR